MYYDRSVNILEKDGFCMKLFKAFGLLLLGGLLVLGGQHLLGEGATLFGGSEEKKDSQQKEEQLRKDIESFYSAYQQGAYDVMYENTYLHMQ